MRPRALPNSFVRGNAIYQRTGAYQKAGTRGAKRAGAENGKGYDGRGLKLVYALTPTVEIRADVPFVSSFERVMWLETTRAFGPCLQRAMANRR